MIFINVRFDFYHLMKSRCRILLQKNSDMKTYDILEAKKTFPSVSIILPTHVKYPHFKNDEEKLKLILKEVEENIVNEFPPSIAKAINTKLKKVYQQIDFTHLSEGLAIYVSREQQKIINLPYPVTEKVIIDKSFEIRDLLYTSKHSPDYLVLTISSNENRLFRGINKSLKEIPFEDSPKDVKEWKIDLPTKTGNFSDAEDKKELTLEKYLRDIDKILSVKLKELDLPVIVCSVERIIGKYSHFTKNGKNILGYVEGNFEHVTMPEIAEKIAPVLEKKSKSEKKKALDLLEEAIGKGAYASGIKEVWKAAMEKRGRLLLLEKGYSCPGKYGKSKYTLITKDIDLDSMYIMKDAVDDLIEAVLKYGGDVVFFENDELIAQDRIALITYF